MPVSRRQDDAIENAHHRPKQVVSLLLTRLVLAVAALPVDELEQHIHHQIKLFSGGIGALRLLLFRNSGATWGSCGCRGWISAERCRSISSIGLSPGRLSISVFVHLKRHTAIVILVIMTLLVLLLVVVFIVLLTHAAVVELNVDLHAKDDSNTYVCNTNAFDQV